MKNRLHTWTLALADLLLPRTCLVCGCRLGQREKHLCLYCMADMPMTFFWKRSHNPMADKMNGLIQEGLEENQTTLERYAYACSLFFYQNEAGHRLILYDLKYKGNMDVGRHFGHILGARMAQSWEYSDVDTVIPVPLHWKRRLSRGYNQAECIAEAIAQELGASLRTDILHRHRQTSTQTKLDVKGKTLNVKGAFRAKHHGPVPRHILLVDDVFTTGSTLHACFVALRKVFPPSVRISVATLGFVGGA